MASHAPDLKSRVRAKTEHDQNVHRQLERALLEHRKAFPRGKDAARRTGAPQHQLLEVLFPARWLL